MNHSTREEEREKRGVGDGSAFGLGHLQGPGVDQGAFVQNRHHVDRVGCEAVLDVLAEVQVPQAAAVGRSLQEGKDVAPNPEEQMLGGNRTVLDALVSSDVDEPVRDGAGTNRVLEVELVLPTGTEQHHVPRLLHQPGRNRVEVVDASDGHLGHVLGHGDGLGPIGGGQGDRLAHQLIREVGAGRVSEVEALHDLSVALGRSNAPFGLKRTGLFDRRDGNDAVHAIGQASTDG